MMVELEARVLLDRGKGWVKLTKLVAVRRKKQKLNSVNMLQEILICVEGD